MVMEKSQRKRWREESNKRNINDSIVFLNQKASLASQMTGNDSYKHNLSPRACLGLFPIGFFLCTESTEIEGIERPGSGRSVS